MEGVKMHRYFVIVNPVAGHGRCNTLFPEIRKELTRRGIDFDFHYTNEPLEAPDVAKMVIEEGFTDIVAMGGDGTVNEVVNGMMDVSSDLPLAIIPAGNGNDFARMNGIPLDPIAAIDLLLGGRESLIDLGHVDHDRYFVNGLGIGIDAQVARDVLLAKHSYGTTAYLLAAVQQVLRFKPFPVTLASGDWQCDFSCISLGIANGKFVGGGFKMTPKAEVADGLLDVCVIEDMSRWKRLLSIPKARSGKHLSLPEVAHQQLENVEISTSVRLVAHIDGEPYRLPESTFQISVCPQALRLVART